MVTRRLRHLRSRPSEEAVRPLPSELETPPVTKMNLLTPPAGRRNSGRYGEQLIGAPSHDNRPDAVVWRIRVTDPGVQGAESFGVAVGGSDPQQLARVRPRHV